MVLVGSVDLAALGRIELDALALLPGKFVLDLLEVPPVPDARRPVPPADVELNDVVRVVGNGNPVKIVDQYSVRSRRCSSSSLTASAPSRTGKTPPLVSAPERALLEVLSEVGVRQPLQEARELVESTKSLRADVLRDLLKRCSSVKTVRLCLQLGREQSQPWAKKLDPSQLPQGSDRPWVSRSDDGLLVLKP
jgi:hypothetical protein